LRRGRAAHYRATKGKVWIKIDTVATRKRELPSTELKRRRGPKNNQEQDFSRRRKGNRIGKVSQKNKSGGGEKKGWFRGVEARSKRGKNNNVESKRDAQRLCRIHLEKKRPDCELCRCNKK